MKKIMFNDKYGLTAAVLQGRKTMTRRAVQDKWQCPLTEIFEDCNYDYSNFWQISDVQFITNEKAPYNVSGRGTWECNPWVYGYTFELVK